MAYHKSALKRIRSTEVRRLRNRYQGKTMRNAVKKFRSLKDKAVASEGLSKMASMIDRMAKSGVIHKNKASNLKSKLTRQVAKMQ
jgi:small subunit ribosomal protein S20